MLTNQEIIDRLNLIGQLCAVLSANMTPLIQNKTLQSQLLDTLLRGRLRKRKRGSGSNDVKNHAKGLIHCLY